MAALPTPKVSLIVPESPAYTVKALPVVVFPNKGRVVPELLEYNINEYREILESYWRIIYRIDTDSVEIFTVIDARRNVQDLLVEKLKRKIV